MFIDFRVFKVDLDGPINIKLGALHGFHARDEPDVDIFSLYLCCRDDGDPKTPVPIMFTWPFILMKV